MVRGTWVLRSSKHEGEGGRSRRQEEGVPVTTPTTLLLGMGCAMFLENLCARSLAGRRVEGNGIYRARRGPSSSPRRAALVWSGRRGARPWCLWRASRPRWAV